MVDNQNIFRPLRGINKDTDPFNQPEDFATYALNAVNNSDEGSLGSMVNEPGNESCFSLTSGYRIVGSIPIKDETVIFSTNGTNSEIGIVSNCNYVVWKNDSTDTTGSFDFNLPITGTFKTIRGCERVIYFVDGDNPDRTINLDRDFDYISGSNFIVNLTQLQRDYTLPTYTVNIKQGGLKEGSYRFALRFEDKNGNVIGSTPLSTEYFILDKGSFRIDMEGFDSTIERYRVIVHQVNRTYMSYPVEINENSTKSFFFVTNFDDYTEISIDQITVPFTNYESSEAIEQVNGRLLRANVKEKSRNYEDYISSTYNADLRYVVKEVPFDSNVKGLMRDEVYAFGIRYLHSDGSISPVFPLIPQNSSCSTAPNIGTTCNVGVDLDAIGVEYRASDESVRISTVDTSGTPKFITVEPDGLGARAEYTVTGAGTSDWLSVAGINTTDLVVRVSVLDGCRYDYDIMQETITLPNPITSDSPLTTTSSFVTSLTINDSNTTTQDITPVFESSTGELGCQASANGTYENPNCSVDLWGSYEGESIKNFRMPDTSVEPLYDYTNDKKRILGVYLDSLTYPNSDVIGHYIVYANEQRTIDEKGIVARTKSHTSTTGANYEYRGFTGLMQGDDNNRYYYFSPNTLFDLEEPDFSYIYKEGHYTINSADLDCYEYDGPGFVLGSDTDIKIGIREYEGTAYTDDVLQTTSNYSDFLFNRDSRFKDGIKWVNTSITNDVIVLETEDSLSLTSSDIAYVSLKNNNYVYNSLENIRYQAAHDNYHTLSDISTTSIFPKDVFISDINYTNMFHNQAETSLLATIAKVYSLVTVVIATIGAVVASQGAAASLLKPVKEAISSISISSTVVGEAITKAAIATGTALSSKIIAGFSKSVLTQYSSLIQNEGLLDLTEDGNDLSSGGDCDTSTTINGSFTSSFIGFVTENLSKVFVESRYNMDFRSNDINTCTDFYTGEYDIFAYASDRLITYPHDDSSKPIPNTTPCVEYYYYNPDLLTVNPQRFSGILYDFCSNCNEHFPNRIVYSQVSSSEDRDDIYRTLRALDYTSIPAHRGEITSIKYHNNLLYVHTTDSTFVLEPNPRTLQSSAETVYIGDGSFLSIPPQELMQSDVVVGGMQSKFASISAENKYIWVDEKNGHVFSAGEGFISNKGLSMYFKENLPNNLKLSLDEKGFNSRRNYLTLTYDPFFKRVILNKRDFIPDFSYEIDPVTPTSSYYSSDEDVFKDVSNVEIPYSDTSSFINKSFTLSYSFTDGSWTSFHSYLPDYMYYDNDSFYTVVDNISYKHKRKGSYQNYYGTKYDYVIEFVDSDPITNITSSLGWYSKAYEYDSTNNSWVEKDVTFDRAWVRNESQSTSIINLVIPGINSYSSVTNFDLENVRLKKSDKNYNVSTLRDVVSDLSLNPATSDWNELASSYFADVVPDTSAHNFNQSQYRLKKLRDKWFKTRLYFKPNDDLKLVSNFIIKRNKYSIR